MQLMSVRYSDRPATVKKPARSVQLFLKNAICRECLHEVIVAAIGRETDRRDDHLV